MAGAELVRHMARGDLQRGKEIDHPMASVIMRVAHGATRAEREGRLRALQRLDGRLLIDTEHNRVLRRVEIQPDDIRDLSGKGRVSAHLKGPSQMRPDAVRTQDVGHAATGAADRVGQEPGRPPTAPGRRRRQRDLHDLLDGVGGHRVVAADRFRPVLQPVDPRAVGCATPLRATGRAASRSRRRPRQPRSGESRAPAEPRPQEPTDARPRLPTSSVAFGSCSRGVCVPCTKGDHMLDAMSTAVH
jgi:hypothetical protein